MEQIKQTEKRTSEVSLTSPDVVRISMAAAVELGLKPGTIQGCRCNCINLLQVYDEGCAANCSYCGLARERPGLADENTFIRVSWPIYPTELIAQKIAEVEARLGVGRVCVSQVHHRSNNADMLAIVRQIRKVAPVVPISGLVNATTMSEGVLRELKAAGADMVGFGLDAATPEIFEQARGRKARGPHNWERYWSMIRLARRLYGARHVNCHVIVGLGETDRDLVRLISDAVRDEIAVFLFSFNPEPGTVMQHVQAQPIWRHRRVQLVKHLIENHGLTESEIEFDDHGMISKLDVSDELIDRTIDEGIAFMTDGCPDRHGVMACNRPYGSYRPGEAFRDYPFMPKAADKADIHKQLKLEELQPMKVA
ncbi:Radical SAM domain protein [Chloroherpeton thalassium ATCC 35110]|uniref:Radical SAM domain protein n=1 Tax=Chloroherpeton thalassium (strain ATCC 35110 / GB-78) TaxID=517418 RepID=B3QSV4_CHLT3|nr:radical SAM protein [Chloroherpeton thalassium]ACF12597.1 Radical SAM domain protein [Chloroherpeton thalassium ATCC 35110]